MKNKVSVIWMVFSLLLLVMLLCCFWNGRRGARSSQDKTASQRIQDYTENYFRFLENVNVTEKKGKIKVAVAYVPEVGSTPIKQEIYQNVAYHALQVVSFFPEVNSMEYKVLWDDEEKKEAMIIKLDEKELSNLNVTYYDQVIAQNDEEETSFQDVFTSVEQTDISNEWREDADKNANLP